MGASKHITLVIDESHSLGILGERGGGIFSSISFPNVARKVMVSSLGKAMGLTGGMIAGDTSFMTHLEALDSFIGAAGMSPAFVETLANGGDVIMAQQRKLSDNLQYLFALLEPQAPVHFDSAYPLVYPTNDKVYQALYDQHILITHFAYAGGALNRMVVAAHHTREDLERLAGALNRL
jgi:7-keto-8-aminopelargonate synthetase-like enzyme